MTDDFRAEYHQQQPVPACRLCPTPAAAGSDFCETHRVGFNLSVTWDQFEAVRRDRDKLRAEVERLKGVPSPIADPDEDPFALDSSPHAVAALPAPTLHLIAPIVEWAESFGVFVSTKAWNALREKLAAHERRRDRLEDATPQQLADDRLEPSALTEEFLRYAEGAPPVSRDEQARSLGYRDAADADAQHAHAARASAEDQTRGPQVAGSTPAGSFGSRERGESSGDAGLRTASASRDSRIVASAFLAENPSPSQADLAALLDTLAANRGSASIPFTSAGLTAAAQNAAADEELPPHGRATSKAEAEPPRFVIEHAVIRRSASNPQPAEPLRYLARHPHTPGAVVELDLDALTGVLTDRAPAKGPGSNVDRILEAIAAADTTTAGDVLERVAWAYEGCHLPGLVAELVLEVIHARSILPLPSHHPPSADHPAQAAFQSRHMLCTLDGLRVVRHDFDCKHPGENTP